MGRKIGEEKWGGRVGRKRGDEDLTSNILVTGKVNKLVAIVLN